MSRSKNYRIVKSQPSLKKFVQDFFHGKSLIFQIFSFATTDFVVFIFDCWHLDKEREVKKLRDVF